MIERAHAVIVPTTSQFAEGFNQVVAEAVLSGRPVITSSVCPAVAYVRDAVVEVAADDVRAYGDAVLRLCDDRAFYAAKASACRAAQAQFYDESRGWAAALKRALADAGVAPHAAAPDVHTSDDVASGSASPRPTSQRAA